MNKHIVKMAPAILFAAATISCGKESASPNLDTKSAAQTLIGLAQAAESNGRYLGSATDNGELSDSAYVSILTGGEFDSITPGNSMKWYATEPSQNKFNYTDGDAIVDLGTKYGMKVRGHTLVWHNQLADWVSSLPSSSVQSAMENHITNVVSHYKGKLYAWDVVNEPFNDDGTYRNDVFYNAMGKDYIAIALKAARAADPDVKLYINDYNIDGIGSKSDAMYSLVKSLLADGVPLDGIGIQGHLAIQYGFPYNMQANFQRFADLGLDVAITELDVRMNLPSDSSKEAEQITYYKNVVNACLSVKRCVGITIWDFTDKYSWIPNTFSGEGSALPWDSSLSKKPTLYNAILSALGGTIIEDTTPPTAPGAPTASNLGSTSVTLSWSAASDESGIAGYDVFKVTDSGDVKVATVTGTSTTISGLSPKTSYSFYVKAFDPAKNISSASSSLSVTTKEGGSGNSCSVSYKVNAQWNSGFTASILITNTGSSPIDSWTLAWTFENNQTIAQAWNGQATQTGANVKVANMSYNSSIPVNGSTSLGFNGSSSGANVVPTVFTLNGVTCTNN